MHPALSVIFFTVTAGAGYGVLGLLVLCRYLDLVPDMGADQVVIGGAVGLALVTLGLLSSTLHLANPSNAWRAFTRFRTSWLSREAVFAVLFYPVCVAWLALEWVTGAGTSAWLLGFATLLLALVILVCTGMIYASLKTIRQWHTPLTPTIFAVLGFLLGALVLLALLAWQRIAFGLLLPITFGLILLAAALKWLYFSWIGQPAGPTINTALGFTRATVRLLDVGHSSGTFLTDEFGYQVARARLLWIRAMVFTLTFLLPLMLLSGWLTELDFTSIALAMLCSWFGIFCERWLFFAEARHVVMLYHGHSTT